MPDDDTTTALVVLAEPVLTKDEENPAYLYVNAGLSSPEGQRTSWQALELAAALLTEGKQDAMHLDWANLRAVHVMALVSRLKQAISIKTGKPYSSATINKVLSAVKGTAKTAWRSGKMDPEESRRIADIKRTPPSENLPGRNIEPGEVIAMFHAAATLPRPLRQRDSAMLALLYGGGMRRSEVTRFSMENYDPATGEARIIQSKREKSRKVFLDGGARAALDAWLCIRGDESGPVLWPMTRFYRLLPRQISAQCVYQRAFALYQLAGLKRLSPHDFRRTIIGDMLDAGVDLLMVQKIVGHDDAKTTERYDRRGDRSLQMASTRVHTPFVPDTDEE